MIIYFLSLHLYINYAMKVALLTYHNGVDITFMSREGLDAVRAPDVPQLKNITHWKG